MNGEYHTDKEKKGIRILDIGREVTVLVLTNNEIINFNPSTNHLNKFYNKNAISKNTEVR